MGTPDLNRSARPPEWKGIEAPTASKPGVADDSAYCSYRGQCEGIPSLSPPGKADHPTGASPMMSADYMHQLKLDAERKSRREGVTPALLLPAHKEGTLKPSIPFIGERTWKRDWVEVDLLKLLPNTTAYQRGDAWDSNIFFVDASGWGAEGELAMTRAEFIKLAPAGFGYAVVEAGQFQVCVKCYIPPKSLRTAGVNYDVAVDA